MLKNPWNPNPFPCFGAGSLNVCHCLRNRFAQDSVSVFGDEQVVFDAYAAEVFERFELVVVDEILMFAFSFPDVDQGRDEVDAWLVGDHEAWFQHLAAAEAAEALLC